MKYPKKRTISLCILWGVLNILANGVSFFEWMYFPLNNIPYPEPDYYAICIIFSYLASSIPLFVGIHKSAKQAKIKWIAIVAKALLIFYSIVLVLCLAVLLLYFMIA